MHFTAHLQWHWYCRLTMVALVLRFISAKTVALTLHFISAKTVALFKHCHYQHGSTAYCTSSVQKQWHWKSTAITNNGRTDSALHQYTVALIEHYQFYHIKLDCEPVNSQSVALMVGNATCRFSLVHLTTCKHKTIVSLSMEMDYGWEAYIQNYKTWHGI